MTAKKTALTPCPHCGAMFLRLSRSPYCSTLCRFTVKYTVDHAGCWVWTAATDGHGYGQINVNRRPVKAYRWALENIGGQELIDGLTVDHLCRNRLCVNPAHLEQVTARENTLRGESPTVRAWRDGVCARGHSLANAITKPNGARTCRPCENQRQRDYYARQGA